MVYNFSFTSLICKAHCDTPFMSHTIYHPYKNKEGGRKGREVETERGKGGRGVPEGLQKHKAENNATEISGKIQKVL